MTSISVMFKQLLFIHAVFLRHVGHVAGIQSRCNVEFADIWMHSL